MDLQTTTTQFVNFASNEHGLTVDHLECEAARAQQIVRELRKDLLSAIRQLELVDGAPWTCACDNVITATAEALGDHFGGDYGAMIMRMMDGAA